MVISWAESSCRHPDRGHRLPRVSGGKLGQTVFANDDYQYVIACVRSTPTQPSRKYAFPYASHARQWHLRARIRPRPPFANTFCASLVVLDRRAQNYTHDDGNNKYQCNIGNATPKRHEDVCERFRMSFSNGSSWCRDDLADVCVAWI